MQLAEQETEAGHMDAAISSIRAAVRFAGAVDADQMALIQSRSTSSGSLQVLYPALERWVRQPEVTPEIVHRTLAELEKHELRWWMTDPIVLEKLYQSGLNSLDTEEQRLGFRGWFFKPSYARQRRVLACELSNQLRLLRNPPAQRTVDTLAAGLNRLSDDPAWAFQNGRYPNWQNEPSVGLRIEIVQSLWDRETRIRGTFAMMAAEAFRKQHGRLPNDLSEVTPSIASRELLTDPWTGALLQIQPKGIHGYFPSRTDALRELKPGVPFIWSPGFHRYQIQQKTFGNPSGDAYDFIPRLPGYPGYTSYYVFPLWTDTIPPEANQPAENPQPSMTPQGGSLQREDQPVDALQPQ